jgi:hypothetical protein
MFGHWRFCVTAFLFFADLSTSPAFSNPLTDLFNPAPKEATAPAPAREECLLQPGKSTEHGQHWFYRLDGHRKCWFQAAEETVSIKKPVRQHSAKQTVIAPEENEAGLRKNTVVDARAQLLSDAPADAFQPTPPAPEVVDPASVPANAAATLVPAVPIVAEPTLDQLTPEHATRRPVDVEMLLAEASLARDTVASSGPPAAPGAPSIPDADEDHWELMATQAGVALIALGLVFLLVGSLLVRRSLPRVAPIRRA